MFSSLRLALFLAPLSLLAPLAQAQDQPSLIGTRLPDPNGFDKLFDAVERLSKADTIPQSLKGLTPTELIAQKRNVVSRNRRSLLALREALALPVQHPPVRTAADDFGNYDGFRTLANILDQESSIRDLDRNWVGAMDSKLDCIELGVLMTRGGPLRAAIAGRDIEIIGRRNIDKLVARLDEKQTAAVAVRLSRIETLRPPFSDAIREGKTASIALTRNAFDVRNWDEVITETFKLNGQPFTEDEQATLQNIGEADIVSALNRAFDTAIATANGPYQPQTARVEVSLDPWSALLAGPVNSPSLRVDYEAARAQNRLFALSMSLRLARIKTGTYPETFETLPDPFAGGAPLKYKRQGDAYLLYSLGPNTKDDGGVGIIIPENGQIPPRSGGDLVAPVLPL